MQENENYLKTEKQANQLNEGRPNQNALKITLTLTIVRITPIKGLTPGQSLKSNILKICQIKNFTHIKTLEIDRIPQHFTILLETTRRARPPRYQQLIAKILQ